MKFRFEAIDGRGRVARGILRASSEEEARDLLMAEEIYAKRLTECDEETVPTWAPKVRSRRVGAGGADADRTAVRHRFDTELQRANEPPLAGRLGLSESGEALVFEPSDGEPMRFPIEELEQAAVSGLVSRLFVLTFITGRTLVFSAGHLFASNEASALAKHILSKRKG